jgi:hypothetical protein
LLVVVVLEEEEDSGSFLLAAVVSFVFVRNVLGSRGNIRGMDSITIR